MFFEQRLLRTGFETYFGWDRWNPAPKVLRSDIKNTSQIQIMLARHFDKKARGAKFHYYISLFEAEVPRNMPQGLQCDPYFHGAGHTVIGS